MEAHLLPVNSKKVVQNSNLPSIRYLLIFAGLILFSKPVSGNCLSENTFTKTKRIADPTATIVSAIPTICTGSTSLSLTASVSPDPQGGILQFIIDGTNAGPPVTLTAGAATLNYDASSLTSGNHIVKAVFTGNASYMTSASPDTPLHVNGVLPGIIAKGASAQGPACNSLNPNITLTPNGTTSIAASGSGTISYLWQQSTDGGLTWTDAEATATIPSNTNVQFNPKSMTVTTRLRRMATSTENSIMCSAYSNELEYVVYPAPVVPSILASNYAVCEGGTLQVTNATPGGVWTSNNLASVTIDASGIVTGVSASAASSSNISYKVTDDKGCSKTVNRTITVKALPVVTSPLSVCNGTTFNLSPSSGGTWVSSNTSVATVTNAGVATTITTGTVSFTYTYNTSPRCSNTSATTNVVSSPLAQLVQENLEICPGQPIIIKGSVQAVGNWTITLNNGSTASGTDNGVFDISIIPTATQTYKITSLSADACNAKTSDLVGEVSVGIKSVPVQPNVTQPIEYCVNSPATALTATGSNLLWYEELSGGDGSSTAPTPSTAVAGNTNYYVSQTVDGCASTRAEIDVIIKDDCNPMPVVLSEFLVNNQEQNVLISWKTTSETNSDHFEIERSDDPTYGFTQIAQVSSHDNHSGARYHYLDSDVPQRPVIYYRLKMVDNDETFAFSRIVRLNMKVNEPVLLFPNPVSKNLKISAKDWNTITNIRITDLSGRTVLNFAHTTLSQSIDVKSLPTGIYIVEITRLNGKTTVAKIAVQR